MRESWTDERLDEMSRRMDAGFTRVDAEIRALRGETTARFDSMQRTMIQTAVGMTASFLAGFAGLAALIATQL